MTHMVFDPSISERLWEHTVGFFKEHLPSAAPPLRNARDAVRAKDGL
jgi:hypothetical protein